MISYYLDDACPAFPQFRRRVVSAWIKDVVTGYNKNVGDVSFVFCNDERILETNRQFLQHDYYTDVITFDYTDGSTISGDIFISIDTVASNAKDFGNSFMDELMRVMIHGILHLCGQDDQTPGQRKTMTEKENNALAKLR